MSEGIDLWSIIQMVKKWIVCWHATIVFEPKDLAPKTLRILCSISDPATGVVLGGSIVGRHAAELISIVALAVTAGLTVHDIQESLFVHPTLAEALADAAE